MSKKFSIAALIALSAVPAVAQTPDEPPHHGRSHDDGHAHSEELSAQESNVRYFWRKSDDAFHSGDFERAVGLHRAIVASAPDEIESYSVAAWLLWSMGRGDEAMAFIARGLKANPQNGQMWSEAGAHYELQKKAPDALAALKRAVELIDAKEDSQMLRRRLAHAAERGGDLPLSIETWRNLARDFPDDVVNRNNLARVEELQKPAS